MGRDEDENVLLFPSYSFRWQLLVDYFSHTSILSSYLSETLSVLLIV